MTKRTFEFNIDMAASFEYTVKANTLAEARNIAQAKFAKDVAKKSNRKYMHMDYEEVKD